MQSAPGVTSAAGGQMEHETSQDAVVPVQQVAATQPTQQEVWDEEWYGMQRRLAVGSPSANLQAEAQSFATIDPEAEAALSDLDFCRLQAKRYTAGMMYRVMQGNKGAKALLHAAHKAIKARFGPNHFGAMHAMESLAAVLEAEQQYGAATALLQDAVSRRRAVPELQDALYRALQSLGSCLVHQGKHKEALPVLQEAFREAGKGGRDAKERRGVGLALGRCLMALNEPAKAVSIYQCVLQQYKKVETKTVAAMGVLATFKACAEAYIVQEKYVEALAMAREADQYRMPGLEFGYDKALDDIKGFCQWQIDGGDE